MRPPGDSAKAQVRRECARISVQGEECDKTREPAVKHARRVGQCSEPGACLTSKDATTAVHSNHNERLAQLY
jgi:hypothetical protein